MSDEELVRDIVDLAQRLIAQLYCAHPNHSTFSQIGLLDGEKFVAEYLAVGELGCAVYHALYMVHEADIAFPKESVALLHELAARIGERNHYSVENTVNLTEEQLQHFYNRPE